AENMKLTEELRKANKIKDQFLANTSHELRTPLHGIMNIAQNVAEKEKQRLDQSSYEEMKLLVTITRRMSRLVDDLLDVVRLKEKQLILKPEPLSLISVVSGVFGMLSYMTE